MSTKATPLKLVENTAWKARHHADWVYRSAHAADPDAAQQHLRALKKAIGELEQRMEQALAAQPRAAGGGTEDR